MATISLVKLEFAMSLRDGKPAIMEFDEAASETFVAGELVYLSGGYVKECGSNPTQILGVALKAAANGAAGNQKVPVLLPDQSTVFRANYCSAAGTVVATAQNIIGRTALLYADTTNSKVQVGNTLDGSNSRVVIVGLDPQDTLADVGGRVLFKFLPKFLQLGATS